MCEHPKTQQQVPIPPLKSNGCHSMTVLPYLMEYHYGVDENPIYYTEHQLNGRSIMFVCTLIFFPFFFSKINSKDKAFFSHGNDVKFQHSIESPFRVMLRKFNENFLFFRRTETSRTGSR